MSYRIHGSRYHWILTGIMLALNSMALPAQDADFSVTNQGSIAYTINGQANPTLLLVRGSSYTFSVDSPGHPLWIKTQPGIGTANPYNEGVSNNGTQLGTITFTVPQNAPDELFYNCQFHASMTGSIRILDSSSRGPQNPSGLLSVTDITDGLASGGLLNISTLGEVSEDSMVAGLIITGSGPKRVVMMGENAEGMNDPMLRLTNFANDILLAENDDWQTHPTADEVQTQLRAPGGVFDAAFAVTLQQGVYLLRLEDKQPGQGLGLISATDITESLVSGGLLNISTRGQADRNDLVAGLIIPEARRIVVMGEDAGGLNDPQIVLSDFAGNPIETNDNWQTHATAQEVETALRAPGSSQDAAFAITLQPGVYLIRLHERTE